MSSFDELPEGLRSFVSEFLTSRSHLREDGPTVDPTIILDLIEEKLSPEEKKIAVGLVGTYRAWNQAWWQIQADLSSDFELDSDEPEIIYSADDETIDAFDRYLAMELEELLSQPEFETLATRSRVNALEPYLEGLSKVVVENLGWRQRRSVLLEMDRRALVELLSKEIEKARLQIPFPTKLVSIALLKFGLDDVAELCE